MRRRDMPCCPRPSGRRRRILLLLRLSQLISSAGAQYAAYGPGTGPQQNQMAFGGGVMPGAMGPGQYGTGTMPAGQYVPAAGGSYAPYTSGTWHQPPQASTPSEQIYLALHILVRTRDAHHQFSLCVSQVGPSTLVDPMTQGGLPAHVGPPLGALPGMGTPAGPTNFIAQQLGINPRLVQSGLGALSSVGGAITGAMTGAVNGAISGAGAAGAAARVGGTSRPREQQCCPSLISISRIHRRVELTRNLCI